jgi:hypothetical protein
MTNSISYVKEYGESCGLTELKAMSMDGLAARGSEIPKTLGTKSVAQRREVLHGQIARNCHR